MNKTTKLSILALLLLLVAAGYIGNYFFESANHIYIPKHEDRKQASIENLLTGQLWFNTLHLSDFNIKSHLGYTLHGNNIHGDDSTKLTIILVHGVTAHRWSMLKYATLYTEKGYNVILYDQMAHGDSEGDFVSYGHYEKLDLQRIVQHAKAIFPNTTIGIHGESMGASTALLHSAINEENKDVDFYIADCGYSNLTAQFQYRLREDYNMPDFGITAVASYISSLENNFHYSEVSPIDAIQKSSVPILFIHGTKDDYVPTVMSQLMYLARKDNSTLFLVHKAKHARSIDTNYKKYKRSVEKFISKAFATN